MLNVIKYMYNDVKSRVNFDNELSEPFESYIGVRQGECLSPFLFCMYLNDIEDEFYWSRGQYEIYGLFFEIVAPTGSKFCLLS